MPSSSERDIALELILQATQKLAEFSVGYDLTKFLKDNKTQSAIIMQLIVIGELAKKLPDNIKNSIDLPWRQIADFRNFAVHEYFELDLNQIWETVNRDVPVVREKLLKHLKQ